MKAKRIVAALAAVAVTVSLFAVTACNENDDDGTQQLAAPSISLNESAGKVEWSPVEHATGYTVTVKSTASENYQTENCYYSLATEPGTYKYSVVATSTDKKYTTSASSNEVTYTVPAEETSTPFTGKIYLVGDSTVCEFSDSYYIPRYGYGTQIGKFINMSEENVINLALSGRSSWSYTFNLSQDSSNKCKYDNSKSCYEYLCDNIASGDYLIIGFGHNDEKTEVKRYSDPTLAADNASTMIGTHDAERPVSFKYILKNKYIDMAKAKGATPILCTPIVRLQTDADKSKYDTDHTTTTVTATDTNVTPNVTTTWNGGNYATAIKELATQESLLCVDLTSKTREDYKTIGYSEAVKYHAATGAEWVDKTTKQEMKATGIDKTHTNLFGAMTNAYYIASEIKQSELALGSSVKTDIAKPVYADYAAKCINSSYTIPEKEPFNPATDASTHWAGITGTTTDTTAPNTEYKWYATAFGGSIKLNSLTDDFTISQDGEKDENLSFTITANAGNGKIASDNDVLACVFIQVPFATALTVTAKANVTAYGGSQAGFGIMIRDDIAIDSNVAVSSNYVNAGVCGDSKNAAYYGYCRNGGALTRSSEKGDLPLGDYDLSLSRTSQSITANISGNTIGSHSFSAVSDFDLAVSDSQYVYICLWATRGTTVTFSNITFTSGVWQQA